MVNRRIRVQSLRRGAWRGHRDSVGAICQRTKTVEAVGVGRGGGTGSTAECDGESREEVLAGILNAVAVVVLKDRARDDIQRRIIAKVAVEETVVGGKAVVVVDRDRAGIVHGGIGILRLSEGGPWQGDRIYGDGVGAVHEACKKIGAIGIRPCLRSVVEGDENIGEARFSDFPDPVAVEIPPDKIADGAARVDRDGGRAGVAVGRAAGDEQGSGGSGRVDRGGGVGLPVPVGVRRSESAKDHAYRFPRTGIQRPQIAPGERARTDRCRGCRSGDILKFRRIIGVHERQRIDGGRAVNSRNWRNGNGAHTEADAVHPEDAGVAGIRFVGLQVSCEGLDLSPRPNTVE